MSSHGSQEGGSRIERGKSGVCGLCVSECVMCQDKKREKKEKENSPTGIRTPVFHVTGGDTNQLYYWRCLYLKLGWSNQHGREERSQKEESLEKKKMEMRGIDPRAPRMQSECSTI